MSIRRMVCACVAVCSSLFSLNGNAQGIPVYDATNVAQNIEQVARAVEQLSALNNQLTILQSHLAAIGGNRGMGNVLNNQQRDYLPGRWEDVRALTSQNQAQYGQLARSVQSIAGQNAVLTQDDLARMPPETREILIRARNNSATQAALSQEAYSRASQNVSQLQKLTDAINSTTDPKSIQELQARIASEQAMLQNDATKLAQASQLQKADERALDLQMRESIIKMGGTSLSSSTIRVECPVPSKCGR